MIYFFTKKILEIALFFFFKKIVVTGREHIPKKGPLLLVANHPNTLIDPLVIGKLLKRRTGSLAKATFFTNSIVSKLAGLFDVIPVYRQQDLHLIEGNNNDTFVKCYEYLGKGGSILIFPEGTSVHELKLREIKTGTARIALGYESKHLFKGNLKIVSIALNYHDAISFRSSVSVKVNPAFEVSAFEEDYKKHPRLAVKNITERIKNDLEATVTVTEDRCQESFLLHVQQFYAEFIDPSTNIFKNPKRAFEARNKLAEIMQFQKNNFPEKYTDIHHNTQLFFQMLKNEKLTIGFLSDSFLRKNKLWVLLGYLFQLVVLFPFYCLGVVFNYIPYKLPAVVFKKMNIDIEYRATVMMLTGLLLFPLFYLAEGYAFNQLVSNQWQFLVLFIISLPLLGFISLYYWKIFLRFKRVVAFTFLLKKEKLSEINALKQQLLKAFKEVKKHVEKNDL